MFGAIKKGVGDVGKIAGGANLGFISPNGLNNAGKIVGDAWDQATGIKAQNNALKKAGAAQELGFQRAQDAQNTLFDKMDGATQGDRNLRQTTLQRLMGFQPQANVDGRYGGQIDQSLNNLNRIAGGMGVINSQPAVQTEGFKAPDITQDAGYQYRLGQGQNAIQNAAAANGSFFSGKNQKDLMRHAQGMASDEYDRAYGRARDSYNINRQNDISNDERSHLRNIGDYQRGVDANNNQFNMQSRIHDMYTNADNQRYARDAQQDQTNYSRLMNLYGIGDAANSNYLSALQNKYNNISNAATAQGAATAQNQIARGQLQSQNFNNALGLGSKLGGLYMGMG